MGQGNEETDVGIFFCVLCGGGVGMGGPVEGRNKQAGGMKGDGSHGSV